MDRIFRWYTSANFKTRITSIVILIVSILMSAIIFSILDDLQEQLLYTNSRLCKDLCVVMVHHIESIRRHYTALQLEDCVEQLYLSTSSIRHIGAFDLDGNLLFSFPSNISLPQEISTLVSTKQLFSFSSYQLFLGAPEPKASLSKYIIVDLVSTLLCYDPDYGFLQLSVSPSIDALHFIKIVQVFTVIVFVVAWLMFALGTVFNFYIIASPIKELLIGLQNIVLGNFGYYIDNHALGTAGDIIISFNEMSKRLALYEKKNVTQLMAEKVRLEALVSTIADGAILLDSELRLLFINKAAVKALNWSNKDMIGEIIFQYLPVHVNEALLPMLNTMISLSCLDNQRLQTQVVNIDLHHGSIKTLRFLLSTILSYKDKALDSVVITIQDVTREAQLNGAKNQFIGNVSHELRTPLCNIRSFLETLIDYDYKLTNGQKATFLSIAHSEAQRLDSLVNDVLDLSRLDSEYYHILYPVSLMNTVLYIIKASQIVALNKKVQIDSEICFQVKHALAHETSLCQILSNLISNSLKFTHQEGKIIVRIYPLSANGNFVSCASKVDLVRIEIIDEGIGVEKVYQKQIFDRFMRIENNIHALKGTGLGLSIVKKIVEKHNSVIQMYSEVGIGTSFWFDLFTAA